MQIEHVRPWAVFEPESTGLDAYTLRVQRLGGCYIARLAGEIDVSNADSVRQHLCGMAGIGNVVVDLCEVTLLDSAALTVLVEAADRAASRGTSFHLAGACGIVLKVLQVTHLDAHLDHHEDIADALEAALADRDLSPT